MGSVALQEFGAFLRARRDALQPEDVGLRRTGRRRVPGLRRDEVAALAGVSVSWYTWLEQGRVRAAPAVLEALCRVLRLDEESRRYLNQLTNTGTSASTSVSDERVRSLAGLLEDVLPNPAFVIDHARDLLGWNRSFEKMFGDPLLHPPNRRNVMWLLCTDTTFQQAHVGWTESTKTSIARFRAITGSYPDDDRIANLVNELSEASEIFRSVWKQYVVGPLLIERPALTHPAIGRVETDVLHLHPTDNPLLGLVVYRATDDVSRARLAKLLDMR